MTSAATSSFLLDCEARREERYAVIAVVDPSIGSTTTVRSPSPDTPDSSLTTRKPAAVQHA